MTEAAICSFEPLTSCFDARVQNIPGRCLAQLAREYAFTIADAHSSTICKNLNRQFLSQILHDLSSRQFLGEPAIGSRPFLVQQASFGKQKRADANGQTFALSDTRDLVLLNVKAEAVEYKGRKAVRLTKDVEKDGFALLRGSDFQDGTIEADIALKITTPPGVRMPGFVGIAFRARPDASRYELFYLRPGNSHAEDQAMRNHVVQYTSEPDFGWYKLRREWPWVYESHAELQTETWTRVKIDVKGRVAKIYRNSQYPNQ